MGENFLKKIIFDYGKPKLRKYAGELFDTNFSDEQKEECAHLLLDLLTDDEISKITKSMNQSPDKQNTVQKEMYYYFNNKKEVAERIKNNENIIQKIASVVGKNKEDIANAMSSLQSKPSGNEIFYANRLDALKKEYIGKYVQISKKPIEASISFNTGNSPRGDQIAFWIDPSRNYDPQYLYKIVDILHYNNKSYTLMIEKDKNAKPITTDIIVYEQHREKIKGSATINPLKLETHNFSEIEKTGTVLPPEGKMAYDQRLQKENSAKKKEEMKNREKLEQYTGKEVLVMHQSKGRKTYMGKFTIENFINPDTYKNMYSSMISLQHFESLINEGKIYNNEYYTMTPEELQQREEEKEKKIHHQRVKEASRNITKYFTSSEKENKNIGDTNFCILEYILTKDTRFLNFFNKKNKSDISLEKLKNTIAHYNENSDKITDRVKEREDTLQKLEKNTADIGHLLNQITSGINKLPEEMRTEFLTQKDIWLKEPLSMNEPDGRPGFPWSIGTQKSMSEARKKIAPFYEQLDQDTKNYLKKIKVFPTSADAKGLATSLKRFSDPQITQQNYKTFTANNLGKKFTDYQSKQYEYESNEILVRFQELLSSIIAIKESLAQWDSMMHEDWEEEYKNTYGINEKDEALSQAFELFPREINGFKVEPGVPIQSHTSSRVTPDMLAQLKNKYK